MKPIQCIGPYVPKSSDTKSPLHLLFLSFWVFCLFEWCTSCVLQFPPGQILLFEPYRVARCVPLSPVIPDTGGYIWRLHQCQGLLFWQEEVTGGVLRTPIGRPEYPGACFVVHDVSCHWWLLPRSSIHPGLGKDDVPSLCISWNPFIKNIFSFSNCWLPGYSLYRKSRMKTGSFPFIYQFSKCCVP